MTALTWNQSLFLWINAACTALPDWLWSSLTITGHTSIVFALFGVFLLPKYKLPSIITALFATAILGGVVSTIAKESFKIMRPPAVLAPDQFHLIGHKLELVSFPSGHTLTAFAVAALLILACDYAAGGWLAYLRVRR
jgi:membrane-associated phospholipid phosphatase